MADFNFVKPGGRVIAEACSRLAAHALETSGGVPQLLQNVQWQWSQFSDLSVHQLYKVLSLRESVFVVEQNCVYLDCDGKDSDCFHLLGWVKQEDEESHQTLAAYLRVLPAGLRFSEASIGRVVVAPEYRRNGLARMLMNEGVRRLRELYGQVPVRISAQSYLLKFYTDLGFQAVGDEYLEDDIPHMEMILP
jgi:ElaA protein